jgi:superfamily II DNA/RNA helicase
MPPPIKKLADKFLSHPKTIEVARPATAAASIDQRMVKVDSRKKKDELVRLLRGEEVKNAIVFCNRKTTVRELATSLKRHGFSVGQIQGDMEQADRIRELDRFKNDEVDILVASDVAARGLDIKGVSHIFNYDVPWHPDDYVHRIGRTGRAGRTGIAITLVGREDAESIENIQKLIGTRIAEIGAGAEPTAEEAKPREERKPRQPRRAREEREPQAEKAAPRAPAKTEERKPRPARVSAERKPRPPREVEELEPADDAEWNGPVPSFLGQGFGS